MRNNGIPIIGCGVIGIILILVLLAINPFITVDTGERALLVRQGNVTGQVYSEGWYMHNPFIEDARYYDIKTQLTRSEAASASRDLQDVKATVAIQYSIKPEALVEIAKNIGSEDVLVDRVINPAIQESVKASTAQFGAEEIITKRIELKNTVVAFLRERLDKYGVSVQEVAIEDITFSEQFSAAIEEKQIAEQERQKAEFEKETAITKAEAKEAEQRLLEETTTPQILERLWIEKWNGQLPTYVGSDIPLYLPAQ